MEYSIYLKSHCEMPDYENECEANSKNEAIEIFLKDLNNNQWGDSWEKDMIEDYVGEAE